MSYDNEGRLSSWTAPGASTTTPSDQFLYDNSGTHVLQRIENGSDSPTETISFDGYTDVTIHGGQTSTTKYYSAAGKTVAMRKDGVLSYLVPGSLGSVNLTLYADGSTESVQLYAPYGATRYSDGTTPTVYGFRGQRFDTTTGLMDYGARYYDPVSGRFISVDSAPSHAVARRAPAKKVAASHANDVVKAVAKAGISVILKGLDLVLGVSSMINDWNTLTSSNASWWDKLTAAGDLALNVGMDVSMFTGVGEGLKIADISAHLAEMLVDHGGEEVAEHAGEGAAAACGGLRFAFATKVAVATGEQSIGTLKPGDQVWAYNQQSKKMELEVIRHL